MHGRNDASPFRHLCLCLRRVFREFFHERIIPVSNPDHGVRRHLPQSDGPDRQPGVHSAGGHRIALKSGLRRDQQPRSRHREESQHPQSQTPATHHRRKCDALSRMTKPSATCIGKKLRASHQRKRQGLCRPKPDQATQDDEAADHGNRHHHVSTEPVIIRPERIGPDIPVSPRAAPVDKINQRIDGKRRSGQCQRPENLLRQVLPSTAIQHEQGPIKDPGLRDEFFPFGKTVCGVGREGNGAEHPDHEEPQGKIQRIFDPGTHPLDRAHP